MSAETIVPGEETAGRAQPRRAAPQHEQEGRYPRDGLQLPHGPRQGVVWKGECFDAICEFLSSLQRFFLFIFSFRPYTRTTGFSSHRMSARSIKSDAVGLLGGESKTEELAELNGAWHGDVWRANVHGHGYGVPGVPWRMSFWGGMSLSTYRVPSTSWVTDLTLGLHASQSC